MDILLFFLLPFFLFFCGLTVWGGFLLFRFLGRLMGKLIPKIAQKFPK